MAKTKGAASSKSKESPRSLPVPGEDDFDDSKYNLIAASSRLLDLRLIENQFSVRPDCLGLLNNEDAAQTLKFGGSEKSFVFDGDFFYGKYQWRADVTYGRKKALKCNSTFLVTYGAKEVIDELYAHVYFQKIAKFTTYPYFRTIFASQSSEAQLVIPPLPTINDRVD